MNLYAFRLHPQQDLKAELDAFARAHALEAACVVTCVGSLRKATLRLADGVTATTFEDKFEIVSLTGTLSCHGSHYHISLADGTGRTIGGHLLEGCSIYTTAEIVLAELPDVRFGRDYDAATGYPELTIQSI